MNENVYDIVDPMVVLRFFKLALLDLIGRVFYDTRKN
jgi:hypothetical protein